MSRFVSAETIRSGLRAAAVSMARHPCSAARSGARRVTFAVPPNVRHAAYVLGVDLPEECELAATEAGFDLWTMEYVDG